MEKTPIYIFFSTFGYKNFPSIFIKTSQFFFLVKADINRQFLRLLATFLGMIIIAIGATENGHSISEIFHHKKSFDEKWRMFFQIQLFFDNMYFLL